MEKISHDDYENFVECSHAIQKQAEYLTNLAAKLSGTYFHTAVLFAAAKTLSLSLQIQEDCSDFKKFLEQN